MLYYAVNWFAVKSDCPDSWAQEIHIPSDTIRLSPSAARLMNVEQLIWPRNIWRSYMHPDDQNKVILISLYTSCAS
jgi:hypothetical protein